MRLEVENNETVTLTLDKYEGMKNEVKELKQQVADLQKENEQEIKQLRRELDDKIKKALDNPLANK